MIEISKFIEYFSNKYQLLSVYGGKVSELGNLNLFLLLVIPISAICAFIIIYFIFAENGGKGFFKDIKITKKYVSLWKNQYFMIPYILFTTIILNLLFFNDSYFNRVKEAINPTENIGELIYTKDMFEKDLENSQVLQNLSEEQTEQVRKEIILAIHGEAVCNVKGNLFYSKLNIKIAPIKIKIIKANLDDYQKGCLK